MLSLGPQSHCYTASIIGSVGPIYRWSCSQVCFVLDRKELSSELTAKLDCVATWIEADTCPIGRQVHPLFSETRVCHMASSSIYLFWTTRSSPIQSIITSKTISRLSKPRIEVELAISSFLGSPDALARLFWRFEDKKKMNQGIELEIIKGKSIQRVSKFTILCKV